ncbi:hypothetical protein YH63_007875 [Afipia massiliensis]|uniref:Uncharacterized protein n=1 Tax=Afipia massiliensis TaxID=211460 RepID=A0A4U6BPE4_9BRAD|nr:hypothetical protein YH63_007875 [Afipia massiliensis]
MKIESENAPWVVEGIYMSNMSNVMAGLVPAISITRAPCSPNRDHRDKPGDDRLRAKRDASSIIGANAIYRPGRRSQTATGNTERRKGESKIKAAAHAALPLRS